MIVKTLAGKIEEYRLNDNGDSKLHWIKTGKTFDAHTAVAQTFVLIRHMNAPSRSFCIEQCVTRINHGRGIDNNIDCWVYVLDNEWNVEYSWNCSCDVLAVANGVIYGISTRTSDNQPRNDVRRFRMHGDEMTPISHCNMKEPQYVKAMHCQSLEKTLVLVSDPTANRLLLFLDDELCWEWQPVGFCHIGPVAISETRGNLYAVVKEVEATYRSEREVISTIQVFDLKGKVTKDTGAIFF